MVAYSTKYNFVYLKTRKTASTSIEMYLQPLCTPTGTPVEERTRTIYSDAGIIGSRLVRPKDMEPLDRKFRAHMYTSILKTELGDEKWSNVIKLTSVRNPFDKVLSNFLWNRRQSKMPPAESLNEEIQEFRDYVRAQAWKADRHGNLMFRKTARNFNPSAITAGKIAVVEVEEIVEVGELDPDEIHLPGIYVNRLIKGTFEKTIEQRTVRSA